MLVTPLVAPPVFASDVIKVPLQTQRVWDFAGGKVRFDCNFSSARLNGCEQVGAAEFKLVISPENTPINNSPWYAFKIAAAKPQVVTLDFVDTYSALRGRPWLSRDGENWQRADEQQWIKGSATNAPTLRLKVESRPVWVSAWDVVSLPQINAWTDKVARKARVKTSSAGNSIEGRPLRYFVFGEPAATNFVFIIGRQHPPEITGTIGLESFVETLAGNSSLAKKFRKYFQAVVLPVVNPDGVDHGHWRSNLGGVDLNRDWRDFSQPETRAVRNLFLQLASQRGVKPWLFMDFHSTSTNIFYAQPEITGDNLPGFTDHWLAALHQKLPAFGFERDDSHNATLATGKAWVNAQWHIPAMTCEFGYQTSRKLIRQAGKAEAEEMIQLLLAASSMK
jgi:predicted deacylase